MFTMMYLRGELTEIQVAVQEFTECIQNLIKTSGAKVVNKDKENQVSQTGPAWSTRINAKQARYYRALHKRTIENNTELTNSKPELMHTVFKLWQTHTPDDSMWDSDNGDCRQACDSEGKMLCPDTHHRVIHDDACTLGELESNSSATNLQSSHVLYDSDRDGLAECLYRASDVHNSQNTNILWDVSEEQYVLESQIALTESGTSDSDTDFNIEQVEQSDFMHGLVHME